MESKHKNALIGGLLAIVFIMAVGFAGFTQQLTITDETTVTSDWNIGFLEASVDPVCPTVAEGETASTDPIKCGSIGNFEAQAKSITFNTSLMSPGDVVTYTVTVKNFGNIPAKIAANGINLQFDQTTSLITYAQSGLEAGVTTLAPDAEVEFTVTVTFPQTEGYIETEKMQNSLTMTIDWEQVA